MYCEESRKSPDRDGGAANQPGTPILVSSREKVYNVKGGTKITAAYIAAAG